jgi:redox-sensitive bicupin YhaK (pirin superfamily)
MRGSRPIRFAPCHTRRHGILPGNIAEGGSGMADQRDLKQPATNPVTEFSRCSGSAPLAAAPQLERRDLLLAVGSIGLRGLGLGCVGLGSAVACESGSVPNGEHTRAAAGGLGKPGALQSGAAPPRSPTAADAILALVKLGAPPWPTFDPFLFCVHHHDEYPRGNAALGPVASLEGRQLGEDFAGKDGWRMYHGQVVPGFPRHPHRGFETVTITRRGYVDHSDSLGATARYGQGDVQWLTAGAGICHAEMFPLLDEQANNPTELFQIWLNLPARRKFAKPHFGMFWGSQIPEHRFRDDAGKSTHVRVIAGELNGARALPPPPDSWAAEADSDVCIWSIRMEPGACWQLPPAGARTERTLYFFAGSSLRVAGRDIPQSTAVRLRPGSTALLESGSTLSEVLLLGARPMGEPVVAYGPFVMNQRSEIAQAMSDYRRTEFGGWPWPKSDPVHARDSGRFAIHADGRKERAV